MSEIVSKHLNSDLVNVFPSAKRTDNQYYQTSRLLSEQNTINLTNRFTKGKSFLISDSIYPIIIMSGAEIPTVLEFCIYGYYFQIKPTKETVGGTVVWTPAFQHVIELFGNVAWSTGSVIYAYIELDKDMLSGDDVNNLYNGLNFTSSIEGLDNLMYLALAKYDGEKWTTINNSKVFINQHAFVIDGGIETVDD